MRCYRWAQIAMKRRAFSLDFSVFTGQEKVTGAFHGYSELKERGWIKLALPKCLNCNLSLLRNTPVSNLGPICLSLRIRLHVPKIAPKLYLRASHSLIRWYNVACLPGREVCPNFKTKTFKSSFKKKCTWHTKFVLKCKRKIKTKECTALSIKNKTKSYKWMR